MGTRYKGPTGFGLGYPTRVPRFPNLQLFQFRRYDLGETVSGPVESRFHGAKVTTRDLGDLLVGLPFQLPQDEYVPVMLRQLGHGLFYHLAEVPLPVHVVRARR